MPEYKQGAKDTLHILYNGVPFIEQKRAMSCWYASAKMIFAFARPENTKIKDMMVVENAEKRADIDALLIKSFTFKNQSSDDKIGTTEKDWPVIAEAFGFGTPTKEEIGAAGTKFDKLVEALVKYGPLWSAGRYFNGQPNDGHVIVAIGAFERMGNKNVIFHNPAPAPMGGGPSQYMSFDKFYKANGPGKNGLYGLDETDGVSPLMYKKAKK
jgi:hypothetical protein